MRESMESAPSFNFYQKMYWAHEVRPRTLLSFLKNLPRNFRGMRKLWDHLVLKFVLIPIDKIIVIGYSVY